MAEEIYDRKDSPLGSVPPYHPYSDTDLTYAAHARCECGAGLAWAKGMQHWDCSDILTGRAIPRGHPGAKTHMSRLSFTFSKVLEETQPSARGATTRP